MKRIIITIIAVAALSVTASAQRWAVGTNVADLADFATIDIEGSYAVSQHLTDRKSVV